MSEIPNSTMTEPDEFKGDNAKLVSCINALLSMDAAGALVPNGIGGHARRLLAAAAHRIATPEAPAIDLEQFRRVAAFSRDRGSDELFDSASEQPSKGILFAASCIAMAACAAVSTIAVIQQSPGVGIVMLAVTVIASVLVYDEFLHMKKEGRDG